MTGVYAYCLTTATDLEGPELAGVSGESVLLQPIGDLTLWLSPAARVPQPSLDAVRAHDEVVGRAWKAAGACVPFRFGQWFASVDAAQDAVDEHREGLVASLERLHGAAELDLTVMDAGEPQDGAPDAATGTDAPPETEGGPGRAYIETLRAREKERERREALGEKVVNEVRRAVVGLVREDRVRAPRGARGVAEMAHLVPRDRIEAWRTALDGVRRAHPELAFLVTGPWPPYSFGP